MEWLKDKKNLPIVAGLGVVILIVAIVAILFETHVIGGSDQAASTDVATPAPPPAPPGLSPEATASAPSGPSSPGGKGAPGGPGALAAKPKVKIVANAAKGPDPFTVPVLTAAATRIKKTTPPPTPVSSIIPPIYISRMPTPSIPGVPTPLPGGPPQLPIPNIRLTTEESQSMRVSGVVLTNGNGIRAVLEANGQSLTVQPGDAVPGGTVVSIQADGLTMKADDGRLVHVPISNGLAGNPQGG